MCWLSITLKLMITFMLKQQRPMDVDTDAYVETDVDVYTDVSGIWLLWLEQGLEDI